MTLAETDWERKERERREEIEETNEKENVEKFKKQKQVSRVVTIRFILVEELSVCLVGRVHHYEVGDLDQEGQ